MNAKPDQGREASGLVRLERIIRQTFSDPVEQQEVYNAYLTIARSRRAQQEGRASLNQWLHDCADHLEWSIPDTDDGPY
jgi:hypothetical protein